MGRPKIERIKKCETCKKDFDAGNKKHKKNCSKECTIIYNQNNKDERMKKVFDGIEKKYGKKSFFETDGFYDDVKKIKKQKYGDENYNNYEKIKSTLKDRYNVEYPSKIEDYNEKSQITKKIKYDDENFNNREKAKKTTFDKIGVDHHLKSKESLEKLKKTNQSKYGVDFTVQTDSCRSKLKQSNQDKYGSDYYFNSEIYLKSQRDKKIEKIKTILEKNDLKFDINKYNNIINKNEQGKFQYVKYQLTCSVCHNKFEWSFDAIPICRRCFPLTSISKLLGEFKDFLNSLKVNYIEGTKQIIKPMELDFYLEDKKIAFELNGNYFHSELGGNKYPNYHLIKTKLCQELDIKLIHIFEDEWLFKKEIVKSMIINSLSMIQNRIYARNCHIKKITPEQKNKFIENNHIQGIDVCYLSLGLFHQDELVSVMTFTKPRLALGINKKNKNDFSVELSRFCSKINFNVIGGFEKLLTHFIKNYNQFEEIYTFADCRWSGIDPNNTVYKKSGFDFSHLTKPNYYYFVKNDYFNRHHRFKFNKQNLIRLHNADPNLTEWEIAKKNKYDRIWDCGSLAFKMKLK